MHRPDLFQNTSHGGAETKLNAWSQLAREESKKTGKKPRKAVISINGYRITANLRRNSDGLPFAVLLDLLDTLPSVPAVLFADNRPVLIRIRRREDGTNSQQQLTITKQEALFMLHLCPATFAHGLWASEKADQAPPLPNLDKESLALPHYKKMSLGSVTFRPRCTQSVEANVSRLVVPTTITTTITNHQQPRTDYLLTSCRKHCLTLERTLVLLVLLEICTQLLL